MKNGHLAVPIFLSLYSLCTLSFAGSYETTKAIEYYKNGEFGRAKSILSTTDISIDPVATYMMGAITLQDGDPSIERKLDTAIYWFQISADLGFAQAHHALGRAFEQRWIYSKKASDFEKSKENHRKAYSLGLEIAGSDIKRLEPNFNLESIEKIPDEEKNEQPSKEEEYKAQEQTALAIQQSPSSKLRYYIGISSTSFTLTGKDITGTNLSTGFSVSMSGESKDKGDASGIAVGMFFGDDKKITLAQFSGEDDDSSIFTVNVTSISIDHSFNNYGFRQGWFLGTGYSEISLETEQLPNTTIETVEESGFLLRGGYEHLFDNQIYFELGVNLYLAEINHKITDNSTPDTIEVDTDFSLSNIFLSLNYVF